jgi:hypothetical protein
MLINESYYTPLSVGIAILVFLIFFQLFRKRLKGKVVRYGGLLLAILVFSIVKSFGSMVYIIEEDLHISGYRSFGSLTIEMEEKGGEEISCVIPFNRVGIVNKSKNTVVIEEIIYGMSSVETAASKQKIEGYSFKNVFLSRGTIDFYFDQKIPDQIDSYTTGDESKYWIHLATVDTALSH